MLVRAHAASNCKEGLQTKRNHRFITQIGSTSAEQQELVQGLSFGSTHLSSLSRQCTRIGNIPDFIRSSMGGLRSLESSFLQENGQKSKLLTNPAWKGAGNCLIRPSPQKGISAATGAGQSRLPLVEFGNLQWSWSLGISNNQIAPAGLGIPSRGFLSSSHRPTGFVSSSLSENNPPK